MKKSILIFILLLTGCNLPEEYGQHQKIECSGVLISKLENGTIDIRNKDRNIVSIRRSPEDWFRITEKIASISGKEIPKFPQGYHRDYVTRAGIRYRMHEYDQTQNDCAFLFIWNENIRYQNEVVKLRGIKAENEK